jgi:hypothetical protein
MELETRFTFFLEVPQGCSKNTSLEPEVIYPPLPLIKKKISSFILFLLPADPRLVVLLALMVSSAQSSHASANRRCAALSHRTGAALLSRAAGAPHLRLGRTWGRWGSHHRPGRQGHAAGSEEAASQAKLRRVPLPAGVLLRWL